MTTGLKTIDQSGIRVLINERLYNPDMFVGKPVIIWRSYLFDGVNDTLAQDLFREYRDCHSREEWKGFWPNPTMQKKEMLGICFIDTSKDYSRTLPAYSDLPCLSWSTPSLIVLTNRYLRISPMPSNMSSPLIFSNGPKIPAGLATTLSQPTLYEAHAKRTASLIGGTIISRTPIRATALAVTFRVNGLKVCVTSAYFELYHLNISYTM